MSDSESLIGMRKSGTRIKSTLKKLGYDFQFFDYLDSYEDRFRVEVKLATQRFPSLVAIVEMDSREYESPSWSRFSLDERLAISFNGGDAYEEYTKTVLDVDAPLSGATRFFRDGDGFKSVVRIQKDIVWRTLPGEEYLLKVCTLFHELGHVDDAERGINIRPKTASLSAVEAEAYANCFALDRLADRCMFSAYDIILSTAKTGSTGEGILADIGRETLSRHQPRDIPRWPDIIGGHLGCH